MKCSIIKTRLTNINNEEAIIIYQNHIGYPFTKTNMKIYFFLFLTTLSFYNVRSQEKLTLKTTEAYLLELPLNYGDFKHTDQFMTWHLDFNNKKISYGDGNFIETFHFSTVEADKRSTNEKNIYNFKNSEKYLSLIVGDGNYLKIKIYSDLIPDSNPASYNTMKIYTNYPIDDFNQILAN